MKIIDAYYRDFVDWFEEQKYTANTKKGYKSDLQLFIRFLKGKYPELYFSELSIHHIERFYEFCLKNDENVEKTINRKYSSLKFFLDWAFKRDLIKKPTELIIGAPMQAEDLPVIIINPDELNKIWEVLVLGKTSNKDFVNLRRKVLFALMWHFGATVSEIYNLNTSDVNMNKGEVTLTCNNKKRTVPVNDELKILVSEYLEKRSLQKKSEAFFCPTRGETEKPSRRITQKEFERILNKTDIDSDRKDQISCSSLRHTRIKMCVNNKRDLFEIAQFFKLDLSSLKQYLDKEKITLFEEFKKDKLFKFDNVC